MKLISCHIENFGKFHEYSQEFCEGANVICEENGWGKSTFAAFLRAMFYGLEGERKRSLAENERKRYKPWQGGVFGGQLVFEIGGRRYQISRIFKDKEANDEFELRDAKTNLVSTDYSKKIGEEIFKINRESFMRTIFIGQSECETVATDDINAKIGNLADNSNDLNNFEAANARLTEIINQLNPNRVSGALYKRREEIARYERMSQGGEGISDSIEKYQENLHAEEERLERLKIRMQKAGEEQTRVSKQQSVLAKKSEWERLRRSVSEKKKEEETCRRTFPGEIPQPEEVKEAITSCTEMEKAYERVCLYQLNEAEETEFFALKEEFADGESLSKRNSMPDMMPNEREAWLKQTNSFLNVEETQDHLSIISKWNQRNSKKEALPSKEATLAALNVAEEARRRQETEEAEKAKRAWRILIIGSVLAVVGSIGAIVLAVVKKVASSGGGTKATTVQPMVSPTIFLALCVILAIFGICLMIAGIFGRKKNGRQMSSPASPELESLRQAIDEDRALIQRTDAEVADYLLRHGKEFREESVSMLLQEIDKEAMERSYQLQERIRRYGQLVEKQEHYQNALGQFKEIGARVIAFLQRYGYEPKEPLAIQMDEIRDAAERYCHAEQILRNAEGELQRFEAENELEEDGKLSSTLVAMPVDEPLPTLEELNQLTGRLTEEMEQTHRSIRGYRHTLESLQAEYDEWEEACARLEELKRQQAEEQKRYNYVVQAREKLGLAKEAMTAKYADPILQGFCQYYEMISSDTVADFHIDANTKVTLDAYGKQRDTLALSTGYRDLIGICLRMALVDAMYREEAPFLVMDDPFTNLDDGKAAAGMEFVKELAEKYQMIYFTCSRARL